MITFAKPTFLGIGAAKAGTTTIAEMLALHPQISLPTSGSKELHFFDEFYGTLSKSWYFSQFKPNRAVGEYTPSYLFDPDVRDRIYEACGPDMKFIVALRNPIDRAYSHYCHAVNNWYRDEFRRLKYPIETLSFEDAIKCEPRRLQEARYHIRHLSYFSKGLYDVQLEHYFKRFPQENFFIYTLDDYTASPAKILKEICIFIGVDNQFDFGDLTKKRNSQTKGGVSKETRDWLWDKYKLSIDNLEKILDRDLSMWKPKVQKLTIEANRRNKVLGALQSTTPLFIVGSPRSGTTLLQCMISTCDSIYSLPETHFFLKFLNNQIDTSTAITQSIFDALCRWIEQKMSFTFATDQKNELEKEIASGELTFKKLFIALVENFKPDNKSVTRFLEKTPFHIFVMKQIKEIFPDAKFINIVRDPRDVVSSRLAMPTVTLKSAIMLSNDWRNAVLHGEAFERSNPDAIITIRYEDLVKNPEVTCKRICAFSGLGYTAKCVEEFSSTFAQNTLSQKETWKAEIQTGSINNKIGVWQKRISRGTAWVIEKVCSEIMVRYDYPLLNDEIPNTEKAESFSKEKEILTKAGIY